MLKKLRLRFVIINMSIVTVMLCIIFGMVYHFTRQNLESQSLSMLRTVNVAHTAPTRPGEGRPQVNLPFFSLRHEEDRWVAQQDNSFYDLSDENYLQELAKAAEDKSSDTGVLEEYGLRFYRNITPMGTQISFVDITSEQYTLRKLIETCLVIGALSFAVFLCISLLLARWAVKPVDTAWKQQKQFVADASHELKTPLTVIQTSTELLQQTEDPTERKQFTGNILEMSHRMRCLIEQLLVLARADNAPGLQDVAPVNLSRTIEASLLPFEPIFFEAGLILRSQVEDDVTVNGDGPKLRQLADILLDNARKYSSGGETAVSLQKGSKYAILRVSNPAEPMTSQQCRDIFKRFYRVDTARTGGESFGLGLSIAESIAKQHGGKIYAACENGIFTVIAELPMT